MSDLKRLLLKCNNEELNPLVKYIITARTNDLVDTEAFKKHFPNHRMYIDEIIWDLQLFGGNSISNVVRGKLKKRHGVPYEEIVLDVADKLKVKKFIEENDSIEEMEWKILFKIINDSMEKASDEEKEKIKIELENIFQNTGLKNQNIDYKAGIPLTLITSQIIVQLTGFAPYKLSVIVANAVAKAILGQGLRFTSNAALTRGLGFFAGPIGIAITTSLTAFSLVNSISGPAYRITVPCVLHIAHLRQLKKDSNRLIDYDKKEEIDEVINPLIKEKLLEIKNNFSEEEIIKVNNFFHQLSLLFSNEFLYQNENSINLIKDIFIQLQSNPNITKHNLYDILYSLQSVWMKNRED